MDKILVICPSRNRPKECARMIDSFIATSKMSSICIALDNDDPCLNEYIELIGSKCSYTIEQRQTTTQIINSKWRYSSSCYKWFCVTNDDFIFRTEGWDLKLVSEINKYGIAYGNDLLAGVHIPTCSVISREIVEILGWLQMPTLTHLYGDNVWREIGLKLGCLYYRDDVIIEHCHVFAHKMKKDNTFMETNSKEMYNKDHVAFTKWLINDSKQDIEKVRNLLCTQK